MQANERVRKVIYREWTLPVPAHHTEVQKALDVAVEARRAHSQENPTDITVSVEDDQIVIGYSREYH